MIKHKCNPTQDLNPNCITIYNAKLLCIEIVTSYDLTLPRADISLALTRVNL